MDYINDLTDFPSATLVSTLLDVFHPQLSLLSLPSTSPPQQLATLQIEVSNVLLLAIELSLFLKD